MTPGLTSTGAVLEAMVLPALRLGGYEFETQVVTNATIVDPATRTTARWQRTRIENANSSR
jgi:hypothetical protein